MASAEAAPSEGKPHFRIAIRDTRSNEIHWVTTSATTKRGAWQFAEGWIDEQEAREAREARGGVLFEVAFEEYLDDINVRQSTMDGYRWDYQRLYYPHFGGMFLHDIDRREVRKFEKSRRHTRARTRRKHVGALSAFFRWCVDEVKYLDSNPAERMKVEKPQPRKPVALSVEEARCLVRAAVDPELRVYNDPRRPGGWKQRVVAPPYLYNALVIALLTGLRRRNVLGMTWKHANLGRRVIEFEASEMKGREPHRVPISDELALFLRSLLPKRVDLKAPIVGKAPLNTSRPFRAVARRAGLAQDLRFHDLRHHADSRIMPTSAVDSHYLGGLRPGSAFLESA